MSDERDELEQVVRDAYVENCMQLATRDLTELVADAILAAGYSKPKTVMTVRELEALPRLSVIRTDEGTVYERHTMWHEAGSRDLKYSPDIILPATVLQLGWGEE